MESVPSAFVGLFNGSSAGKKIVKLGWAHADLGVLVGRIELSINQKLSKPRNSIRSGPNPTRPSWIELVHHLHGFTTLLPSPVPSWCLRRLGLRRVFVTAPVLLCRVVVRLSFGELRVAYACRRPCHLLLPSPFFAGCCLSSRRHLPDTTSAGPNLGFCYGATFSFSIRTPPESSPPASLLSSCIATQFNSYVAAAASCRLRAAARVSAHPRLLLPKSVTPHIAATSISAARVSSRLAALVAALPHS
ncbi:hypothetical protein PIB30_014738 [Stylosanthes scabra]|uniref:Uncharacterized protein n=1 Tax=Stylosanthes scabra TaxID=79078 RepID=A0ABU6X8M9_9FABA|nr:hypothetical protein [Stylosanthes scabra]